MTTPTFCSFKCMLRTASGRSYLMQLHSLKILLVVAKRNIDRYKLSFELDKSV